MCVELFRDVRGYVMIGLMSVLCLRVDIARRSECGVSFCVTICRRSYESNKNRSQNTDFM